MKKRIIPFLGIASLGVLLPYPVLGETVSSDLNHVSMSTLPRVEKRCMDVSLMRKVKQSLVLVFW